MREQGCTAEGLVAGQSDGDEVKAGLGKGDAAVCGDVKGEALHVRSGACDDDGGGGSAGLSVDEVEQLVQGGVAIGGVYEEHSKAGQASAPLWRARAVVTSVSSSSTRSMVATASARNSAMGSPSAPAGS